MIFVCIVNQVGLFKPLDRVYVGSYVGLKRRCEVKALNAAEPKRNDLIVPSAATTMVAHGMFFCLSSQL